MCIRDSCWGAQAAVHHFHGMPKHPLPEKAFGVFRHRNLEPASPYLRGFSDNFSVPVSRWTEVRRADIVVAAIGIPQFVKGDWVKEGAVVVDVGINRIPDDTKKSGFRLVGDVDFDEVAPKCSHITPVPGGVGLMTVTALLMNTLKACRKEIYQ